MSDALADPAVRSEIGRLAHDLDAPQDELLFLADRAPDELADLRAAVSSAIRSRQATRTRLLAGLSRRLPVAMTARIAEHGLGPLVSARVAGALEPEDAARLAAHLAPAFLARLAGHLDPDSIPGIAAGLSADLVVEVGGLLLAAGDHVTLARFVAAVPTDVALRVVADASAADLVWVALYAEDDDALAAIAERLTDDRRAEITRAAAEAGVPDPL